MAELHRFPRRLSDEERMQRIAEPALRDENSEAIERSSGSLIDLTAFDQLFREVRRRIDSGSWPDRAESDRWLAPRLHPSLRLNRAEAADQGIWEWLAVRVHGYVEWRWSNKGDAIVSARWRGPIHKQALARLWWGAEIFRDGADYDPVERAFIRQDLPNSLLHRPLVRCRSLALGLVEVVAPRGVETIPADEVNALARALNLAIAGSPPEVETGFRRDDVAPYIRWTEEPAIPTDNWNDLPRGPYSVDTTEQSRLAGRRIAERGRRFAAAAERSLHTNERGSQ